MPPIARLLAPLAALFAVPPAAPHPTLLVALVLAIAATAPPAAGRTHIVPDALPTIQAAIDSAAGGDTVLVRAGTYAERLVVRSKSLTLVGEGGPDAVVLDPSTLPYTNICGRAISLSASIPVTIRIQGVHVRKSVGTTCDGGGLQAVGPISLVLAECRFTSCVTRAMTSFSSSGGAVHMGSGTSLHVSDCEFTGNGAIPSPVGHNDSSGGAIYAGAGSIVIIRCRFQGNAASGNDCGSQGGALSLSGSTILIEDSYFEANGASFASAISSNGNLTLRRCTLTGHTTYGGIRYCGPSPGSIVSHVGAAEFQDCEITGNNLEDGSAVRPRGAAHVAGCSFAFNTGPGAALELTSAVTAATVAGNLFASNSGTALAQQLGDPSGIACNIFWGNRPDSDDPGLIGLRNNQISDPLFCDPASKSLSVAENSACLPGGPGHPAACGPIGKVNAGCPAQVVERWTWGAIKARF